MQFARPGTIALSVRGECRAEAFTLREPLRQGCAGERAAVVTVAPARVARPSMAESSRLKTHDSKGLTETELSPHGKNSRLERADRDGAQSLREKTHDSKGLTETELSP
jgi:hypothetical protein